MADILIRGMELPTVCGRCPIEQFNEGFSWEMYCCPLIKDGYTTDIREVERRDDCPLHELPEHGDLIERDAFIKSECLDRDCLDCECDDRCDMIKNLKIAPVIVPSNKEDANG